MPYENEADREMASAEDQAGRNYVARCRTRDSAMSLSSDSSTATEGMGRIATEGMGHVTTASAASMGRVRTSAVEYYRSETHRLQQAETVGVSVRSRKSEVPLPAFGGGKPYPPELPPYEDFVVEFDGPDDPLHPQNWPTKKKLIIATVLSYTSLCSTFASSIFSASTARISHIYGISIEVSTLSTSLYVLGYAFGPLIWGPFSELKGRKPPFLVSIFGFMVFNFACATSKDLQTLLICRFFAGFFGSCPLANVAAAFSDMFDNTKRGIAIVAFAMTVFLGPLLGPFVGGFIQMSYLQWRWNLYIPGIMAAAGLIAQVAFLEETYPPMVLVAKASELRRRTKNWGIHAKQEEVELDIHELITKNFSRPIRLLITEPVVLLLTIYMSFVYGLLYLFLTAYPIIFQGVHGMNEGVGSLPLFGVVIGVLGAGTYIIIGSGSYNKKLAANGGIPIAEWRLPPVMLGGVIFSMGLFWFGWTGFTKSIPWIVPTLSGLFTGFGLLAIFISCFNYLIDSYLMFAASVIAANTFLRSITAAGFPLFGRQMFTGMGIQWAGTLLGCFSAALVPIPVLFYMYGAKLREKSKFAPKMKPTEEEMDEGEDADSHGGMIALAATRSRAYASSASRIPTRYSVNNTQRNTQRNSQRNSQRDSQRDSQRNSQRDSRHSNRHSNRYSNRYSNRWSDVPNQYNTNRYSGVITATTNNTQLQRPTSPHDDLEKTDNFV